MRSRWWEVAATRGMVAERVKPQASTDTGMVRAVVAPSQSGRVTVMMRGPVWRTGTAPGALRLGPGRLALPGKCDKALFRPRAALPGHLGQGRHRVGLPFSGFLAPAPAAPAQITRQQTRRVDTHRARQPVSVSLSLSLIPYSHHLKSLLTLESDTNARTLQIESSHISIASWQCDARSSQSPSDWAEYDCTCMIYVQKGVSGSDNRSREQSVMHCGQAVANV